MYQTLIKHSEHDVYGQEDRKSTRLNSSHLVISYAVFCLKNNTKQTIQLPRIRHCYIVRHSLCKPANINSSVTLTLRLLMNSFTGTTDLSAPFFALLLRHI